MRGQPLPPPRKPGSASNEGDEALPYQEKEPLCELLEDVIVLTVPHGGNAS